MSTEIIYGTNPVLEILRAGRRRCHEVIIATGRREADVRRIEEAAARAGVAVSEMARQELGRVSEMDKHQGIVARCDGYPYSPLEDILDAAARDIRKSFLLILDGITDPQNLGSLVRTAHLMGVHGVILPRDNAASVTPSVVKASAGATEHQLITQVTNIANTISYIKDKGFWAVASDGASPDSIYQHDFKGYNIAVVLGSEGRGVRRLIKERCDYRLAIPMEGQIASYNVSVAGALFMGEVARQRWLSLRAKSVLKSP